MTSISRAKRHIKCCGRWNTKFHRRCEKQIKVAGCGFGAECSASNSTGTPARVSIFGPSSLLNLLTNERVEGDSGSATATCVNPNFVVAAVQHSPGRPIDRLSRAWKDCCSVLDGDE